MLRQAAREEAQLKAANEQLRAGPATAAEELARARAAPNFWPKDQLALPATPTLKPRSRRCSGR